MVRYCFRQGDLLRTRFAIAPLMELVGAVYALRDPAYFAVHRAVGGVGRAAHSRARSVAARCGNARRRRTASGRCSSAHRRACHTRTSPRSSRACAPRRPSRSSPRSRRPTRPACRAAAQPFLSDTDARALANLVEQMRAFWDAALAPWGRRISAALEAEIAARARALVALGPQAAFTGLHQTVRWEGRRPVYVHPTRKAAADVDLADRGLLLVPAVFTWPSVWPRTDPPWDPALVYPPPGTADVWRARSPRAAALKALLGSAARPRAARARPAGQPRWSSHGGCRSSAGGVNSHLSVLRQAGPRQPPPGRPPRDLHAHRPSATPSAAAANPPWSAPRPPRVTAARCP